MDLWTNHIYFGAAYVQNLLFVLTVANDFFKRKTEKQKAWMQAAGIVVTAFGCGIGMSALNEWMFQNLTDIIAGMESDDIKIHIFYMIAALGNVLRDIGPSVLALVTVCSMYQGNRRTKIFFVVLFLLILSALSDFGAEITYNVFSTGNDGYARLDPIWYLRILIDGGWLAGTYLIYKRYIRKPLKNLLLIAREQISNIVLLPGISYVVFEVVKGTMYTYSITISSTDPGTFLSAGMIRASIMIIYFLMYQAIFEVIHIGAGAAQVKAELNVASRIQLSALPRHFPAFPDRKEIEIYAAMHPAKEVGGDFYDFFFIDEDRLALLIADVSGKGVPAALFMMSGQSIIRNQALLGIDPGEIFQNANNQLVEHNEEGMFITAFLGILNVRTGQLQYCNAGHCAPYLVHSKTGVRRMEMDTGFVLAALENMEFRTETTTVAPGEMLILYTDGVTEAVNQGFDMYEENRLADTLAKCGSATAEVTVQELLNSIYAFADGAEQADDITLLVASRL